MDFLIFIIVLCIILFVYCDYKGYIPHISFAQPSYEELLKTKEWQQFRSKIINQHHCKCDWCGSNTTLQVHHKVYRILPNGRKIEPWKYKDTNVMCLCKECHKNIITNIELKLIILVIEIIEECK